MAVRWLCGVLLLAACGARPAVEPLLLLDFRQNGLDTVALNEELAFFFSSELDPSSVTSDSLCILDADGRPVRGERRVRRDALLFLPELPRRADLSDGAFVPGARYTAVLGGFPRLDGIRSEDGALLSATLRLEFRTAEIGKSALFLSPFVPPFPLRCRGKGSDPVVLEDGRIVLEAREPIDPSQVPGARIELRRGSEPLSAHLELLRNEREFAELLVVPDDTPDGAGQLDPGTYYFRLQRDLRTLGGRELVPAWRREVLKLFVPSRRVEFPRSVAPELPDDCDGTALPTSDGTGLWVRYPKAAGDGSAGEIVLAGRPSGPDLSAARLLVPAGASVDLSDWRGPLVLRSQTTLELAGHVTRRGGAQGRSSPLAQELRELADELSDRPLDDPERPALDDWLARLRTSEESWTVLIAGGDLRVLAGASLEVDGPLVLVAGGWIRVAGQVTTQGDLWRTPEGSGAFAAHSKAGVLPFRIEPPSTNPLVLPFRAGFTLRLRPEALAGAERVVPLQASSSLRVLAELQGVASGSAQLHARFELWPRPGEPWQIPASGFELVRGSGAREAR